MPIVDISRIGSLLHNPTRVTFSPFSHCSLLNKMLCYWRGTASEESGAAFRRLSAWCTLFLEISGSSLHSLAHSDAAHTDLVETELCATSVWPRKVFLEGLLPHFARAKRFAIQIKYLKNKQTKHVFQFSCRVFYVLVCHMSKLPNKHYALPLIGKIFS